MTDTAFYAGSFDPLTNGHVDVVLKACGLARRLVIAIGVHPGKTPMFPVDARLDMLEQVLRPIAQERGCELEIVTFDDLTVEAARRVGASLLIRGLRDATDFDYEMQIAGMNAEMASDLQTVFLPASSSVRPITATLVRQIAGMGGDVSAFVPPFVAGKLAEKFTPGR